MSMPYRKTPLITGEIYHVFNRSVARQPIFVFQKDYKRALDIIGFYIYQKPLLRFSHYNRLPEKQKTDFIQNLKKKGKKQINLISFCIMPNHFHFLIKEIHPEGITTFMRNFQNSYAKYFNKRSERSGAVFQSMFKAIRIETEEQLLHVCRYIHLNPLTSYLIKDLSELETYPWNSFKYFLENKDQESVDVKFILDYFPSIKKFKEFIFDQIDYQRRLDQIRHLIVE